MRQVGLVLLVVLVGCSSPDGDGSSANTMIDAAATPPTPHDATGSGGPPGSPSDVERTPFTITGTTPAGSLDEIRFMSLAFVGGHCPGTYYLKLYRTDAPEDRAVVAFSVSNPPNATQPQTGTITASAWADGATTDQGSFEIVQLDAPGPDDTGPAMVRMAGRFTINAPGWNVDFNVDATTRHLVCLIL